MADDGERGDEEEAGVIEHLQFYKATVKIRRDWPVKSGAERWDGRRVLVMASGHCDPDWSPYSADEWYMELCEASKDPGRPRDEDDLDPLYFASGDLMNLENVPFDEGLARRKMRWKLA
jgi:hypothetical protein